MENARQYLSRRWRERRQDQPFTPAQAFGLEVPENFTNPFVAFSSPTPATETTNDLLASRSIR